MRAKARPRLMDLSIPTLQFTDFIVFLTCGLVFVCCWVLRRSRRSFVLFGASFLLCAVMSVSFADFGAYGSVLSPLGWSVAGLLFWAGFRVFDGRRPVTPTMAFLAALPASLHVGLEALGAGEHVVNTATTLAYAAHECAVAFYVLSTSKGSPLRKGAAAALLAIALAIVSPLLTWSPEAAHWTLVFIVVTDISTSIILTTVILAIESERAFAAVERMAHRDPLTGALNRLGFEREIEGRDGSAGIILADLDHFKSINDRFGHSGGDHVLRKFVGRAVSVLPENTVLARFGGEEFVAVIPGIDERATLFLAERLRNEIECRPIEGGGEPIPVTVSVGVSTVPRIQDALNGVEKADAALYAAKKAGRNLVRAA